MAMMLLRYNIYFNGFIFCEFLNFAIVLIQFLITNQFLSRRFILYGLEVASMTVLICIDSERSPVIMLNGAGLAVLPASLGGATSSFCQKPNVPNISKDRFECVLIICTMQNHIEEYPKKKFYTARFQKVNFLSILAAACNYWRWGGSGSQENINAICILGLNIVNDKVRAGGQRQQHQPSSFIAIIADQVFHQMFH